MFFFQVLPQQNQTPLTKRSRNFGFVFIKREIIKDFVKKNKLQKKTRRRAQKSNGKILRLKETI